MLVHGQTVLLGAAGQSAQLTVRVGRSNPPPDDVTTQVVWQSANPHVASVSPTGMVTTLIGGQTLVTATYGGRPAHAPLNVFNASITTMESFTGTLKPKERRLYPITIGTGGRDISFVLISSLPGSGQIAIILGSATGDFGCGPPFRIGGSFAASEGAGSAGVAELQTGIFDVSAGRYCLVVIDPATITDADQLGPFGPVIRIPLMSPADYALTVALSGSGGAVFPTAP